MSEIDVNKCKFYNDFHKTCSNFTGDQPYCNPKDLKCSHYICYLEEQLQKLKQENEELKEEYAKLQYSYNEATQPNDYATRKSQRADRILKCFDEIKEIVRDKCIDCDIDDNSYCPECRYEAIKDVRKKINEVKRMKNIDVEYIAKLEQENEELKDKIKKIQNRLSQIEYTASIDVRELRYDLIRIIENEED